MNHAVIESLQGPTGMPRYFEPESAEESSAEGLTTLLEAVSPTAPPHRDEAFIPPVPQRMEDTGLTEAVIEELVLKILFTRGEVIGRDIADTLGLKFSVIEPRVEFLKRQRLIEIKGSLGFGSVSGVFIISEAGRARAREYMERNQYLGAAPVPIAQYNTVVRSQRAKTGWLTQQALRKAYEGMIVSPDILSQIGPAVNSGKSFLMYGQPGNGKTYLAEALFRVDSTPIYVPYTIECQGQMIKVFDPVYHHPVDPPKESATSVRHDAQYDARWVRCRRPFIVTGGELSISMLDLGYNSITKVYDAPFQLKANNGIYLIDDFGRQKTSPAEVLNRWIVPMDRRVDYLSFNTGGKMEVPFETFLIFSTNLQPESLGDEAFLRRIQYKMFLRNPVRDEFVEIFISFCGAQGLECSLATVDYFIAKHYEATQKKFRRCQPRDVISHAIDLINFEQLPFKLTEDLLDRSFAGCFVSSRMDE